jgi:hypothetical protein
MTPTNLTTYDSSGNITFNTDFKYIKTIPSGNMQITPLAAAPINYITSSYAPIAGSFNGTFEVSTTAITVQSNSGLVVLTNNGPLNSTLDQYATYAFPSDGNVIFGPTPFGAFSAGSENVNTVLRQGIANTAAQPLYADVYSGLRYIGTLRIYEYDQFQTSGRGAVLVSRHFTAYLRSDPSYYNADGIIRSATVYKGEKLRLYRDGACAMLYSATTMTLPGRVFTFLFNSGSTTIPLAVTT